MVLRRNNKLYFRQFHQISHFQSAYLYHWNESYCETLLLGVFLLGFSNILKMKYKILLDYVTWTMLERMTRVKELVKYPPQTFLASWSWTTMSLSDTGLQEITWGEKFTVTVLKDSPSFSEMYRVGSGFRTLTITWSKHQWRNDILINYL